MVISDIPTHSKTLTYVTFVEQPATRTDKERWAVCLTTENHNARNDIFIQYKVLHRVENKVRMWRSIDAAAKAIRPFIDSEPYYSIKFLPKQPPKPNQKE